MKECCPSGQKLTTNNETIVNCIFELKSQYQDMCLLLKKQEEERGKLQTEMDRIAYKLLLLNKGIAQRTKNIQSYEKTISEAEARYGELVNTSTFLVQALEDTAKVLEESMGNKKVGPDDNNERCSMITPEQEKLLKKYINENVIIPAENAVTFILNTSTKI